MFGGSAIAERAIPERAEDILATIKRERVTALHFMPPVIFQLCNAENVDASMMSTVRYLSSTGQTLPEKYIHQLRHTFPNVDLLSMYGMNEATRVLYLPPEQIERRPTSVGKAIPGVRTYLVDDCGGLIARANQVGELAVAGDLVMQGYWQLPEQNARVFRHDVFGEDRIFLTGDMFRMDEEGYLYYVCRKDDVFTRSMFQVNPKEIERHLLSYDGVAEAVVVPVAAPGVGHVPKANVVLTAGASDVTPAKLIDYCNARLDWHMVPAEIEILKSLPRGLSGKTKIRDVSAAPTLREEGCRVDGEYLRNTAMLRLAEQFDDLAAGRRQVPRQPVRTELLHEVADHRRMAYHNLLTSKMGPLFAHFLASVPYILEELCRVGVAIEALSRWRSERANHASAFFEADAFDGSNGRALGRYSDFKIATLTNSPNPANKEFFDRFVEAGQAAFFQGTFLELDRSVLSSRAEYSKFSAGFDYIYETAALQFYGTDRDWHVEHLANLLRPEGLAIFMHKLSHFDQAEFRERERRKDETFKTKYFTAEEIAWKREQMLDQMHTGLIPLQETIAVMKRHFRHVGLIWNSGNFHEILASNDRAMFDRFLSIIGEPIIPAEFCTERLGVC
jgi:SAM-dependent methyltransferase